MLRKSKLLNAKQKISKLKEKYFNSSNFTKDDDDDDIIDFLPSPNFLENNKSEKDPSKFNVLNDKSLSVHEIRSLSYDITNLFDDSGHNEVIKRSSQTLGSNLSLIGDQHTGSHISNNHTPSELSHCSKITNKTLKTESIILSDLSNQFEHICFLSSSSDEEKTTGLHPEILSVPQTGRNLSGILQVSVPKLDDNSETNKKNVVHKREVSSSELSEIQSDINSGSELSEIQSDINSGSEFSGVLSDVISTVLNNKEHSVKICLENPIKYETNNFEQNFVNKKEISKDSTMSNKKQTSVAEQNFKFNFLNQTKDNSFTESSDKINVISLMKEKNPSQRSTNIPKKPKRRNYKTTEHDYVPNLNLEIISNNLENSERLLLDGEDHEVTNIRYVDRSESNVPGNNTTSHEGISSLLKKSRRKYPKRSKTVLKHSVDLKPSRNRPILKSCVLIEKDEFKNENKCFSTETKFATKLDGCGFEEVISQLLRHQIQLTRHFIHSHHQMYLTCCQAVKLLSEKHNNRHIA